MVLWTFIISTAIGCLFLFVIFFGAPFLPTQRKRTTEALELLNLKPGQTMLELGSGDGRVLREAASRGVRAIGYELNPILVLYSRIINLRYRHLVTVKWANYWRVRLPDCDALYVFLLKPYMSRLDKKVSQEITKPVTVLSFLFPIPDRQPLKLVNGLHLYEYRPLRTTTEHDGA